VSSTRKWGWARALALVLAAAGALGATLGDTATAPSADVLDGLWAAKRRFGPDARGPLLVRRSGDAYVAELVGRLVPIRSLPPEVSFELPDGQGAFRGRFEDAGRIRGRWIRPGTPVNNGRSASPLLLEPDGPDRWRGVVSPTKDDFTFYLLATGRPDGSLGVVLRNPERDFGSQIGAERLVRDGEALVLMGRRAGQPERELARGAYDAERDFYPRGRVPGRYSYLPPPELDDGWRVGTLDEAEVSRAGMEALVQRILETPMDSIDAPQIHALLVARRGKLVLEEYFHGFHRDELHDTRSAAKSLTAIVVGAAIQAGAPLDLSSRVYEVMNGGAIPPDVEAQKREMTLEHLLTMSSGWYCDDTDEAAPGNEERISDQQDEPD
jgi:hypothetical protein